MGFFSKSVANKQDEEKDKWKDKYLHLIDQQEKTEQATKEQQELLCKVIVRLSIAASGVDQQLEPYLQAIRTHIKSGINSVKLKTELENFTNALNRIGEGKEEKPTQDNDVSLLIEFLLGRYPSPKQQQALLSLQSNAHATGKDTNALFSCLIAIIEDGQPTPQTEELLEHSTDILQTGLDPSFISTQLLQLLNQIEIPETLSQKAEDLKQELVATDATSTIEVTIDNVISLLIDIHTNRQPKQQEIDRFLSHITAQLTELGMAITDSGIAIMDASLRRNQLDQSVSAQISDLQTRSVQATQLEPLKAVISSHIAKISKEIQEHKQKEASQREQYQHQLEELGQKIKAMETETGELQTKLVIVSESAQRDALTNLPNRMAYDERLAIEIARWQRYHTPLCLVIWDIDFFKKVNDQFGHQAGDKVLAHVASQLATNIRRADFVARFGGEEFVMLLPHTKKQLALKVTDKLRDIIEQSQLEVNNAPFSITISCGLTQFISGDTPETAFARADQALYRAKDLGRNQCCMV
jgi:diguanylate cyclase